MARPLIQSKAVIKEVIDYFVRDNFELSWGAIGYVNENDKKIIRKAIIDYAKYGHNGYGYDDKEDFWEHFQAYSDFWDKLSEDFT